MVKVMSLLINGGSGLSETFEVRALTEMEILCIKGMFMLKVVSSENNLGFKWFFDQYYLPHFLQYEFRVTVFVYSKVLIRQE